MSYSDILELLLNHGATPNGIGNQRPLVDLHIYPNAIEILPLFVAAKDVDLNHPRDALLHEGKTPEWMEMLCKAGADPNLLNWKGSSPLLGMMAVEASYSADHKANRLECAKVLLKYGADPNLVCGRKRNFTPFLLATMYGFHAGMELLLAHGADPKLASGGKDAFDYAKSIKPKRLVKRAQRILEAAVSDGS